jgi:hypothetical protein
MKKIVSLTLTIIVGIYSASAFAGNHKRHPASGAGTADPAIAACQSIAEKFVKNSEAKAKVDVNEITLTQNRAVDMGEDTGPGVTVVPTYLNFEYWVDRGSSGDPVVYEMAFVAHYTVSSQSWSCDAKPSQSQHRIPLGSNFN